LNYYDLIYKYFFVLIRFANIGRSFAASQSSRIIIDNSAGSSDAFILKSIINRLKDENFKYDIEEVWVYEKGKVRRIY